MVVEEINNKFVLVVVVVDIDNRTVVVEFNIRIVVLEVEVMVV